MHAAGYIIKRKTYNKGTDEEIVCDPDTAVPTGTAYEECYTPSNPFAQWLRNLVD